MFRAIKPAESKYKYPVTPPEELKDYNQFKPLEGYPVEIKKSDGSIVTTTFKVSKTEEGVYFAGIPVKEIMFMRFNMPTPEFLKSYFVPSKDHPVMQRMIKMLNKENMVFFLYKNEVPLRGYLRYHLPYSLVVSPSKSNKTFMVIMKHALWMFGPHVLVKFIPYFNAQLKNLKESGQLTLWKGWRSPQKYLNHKLSKKIFTSVFYNRAIIVYTVEKIGVIGEAAGLSREYLMLKLFFLDKGLLHSSRVFILRHAISGIKTVRREDLEDHVKKILDKAKRIARYRTA